MRIIERQNAIDLRKKGLTYDEIHKLLNVSKGTLSSWLHSIPFVIKEESYNKRRLDSIRNSQILHKRKIDRVSRIVLDAKREILNVKSYELKLLGAIAYWTEGSKTQDNLVKFTNSNPAIIKFILIWLREVCFVPEEKLRVHLRIHEDLYKNGIEQYWSEITGIPLKRFYKTTLKISASNGKRYNKLKYGVATIIVCNTELFYRIKGWIEGIIENMRL